MSNKDYELSKPCPVPDKLKREIEAEISEKMRKMSDKEEKYCYYCVRSDVCIYYKQIKEGFESWIKNALDTESCEAEGITTHQYEERVASKGLKVIWEASKSIAVNCSYYEKSEEWN